MRYAIFISLLLVFTGTVNAQSIGVETTVNFELVPEIPKAGELVYVYLSSYSTNINTATITWRVDGKTITSGVGVKTFSFTMGPDGIRKTLAVTIRTSEGETISRTFNLRPTTVDLIWQSNGFVPPFYKGKSVFSHQNSMTLIAMPHLVNSNGVELNPRNLIYTWKKNGSVQENASGYGKNSYTFEGSIISRAVDVSVEVTSTNTANVGIASMRLTPKDPDIIFYKKNPTYGIELQKALMGDVELNESSEVTIIGIPFSFSGANESGERFINKWSINGNPVVDYSNQNVQTFRRTEGVSGTARISLSVENPDKVLQFSSKNFNLLFGNTNESQ